MPGIFTGKYLQQLVRRIIRRIQQYESRAVRLAISPLPMAQGTKTDSKGCSKLVLGQSSLFPDTLYINCLRCEYPDPGLFAFAVGNGFFHPPLYAFK